MTYFPGLSNYTYFPQQNPMLNVGWLDRDRAFATGPLPDRVVATLTRLADKQHNIACG